MNRKQHRVVLADDEPIACERLRMLLQEHPDFRVVAECNVGEQALEVIQSERPDAAFLDIRMPGLTGIEVAQRLLESGDPPLVVFVTAFDEFAIQGFEVSAVDYLLKPVTAERFGEALERISHRLSGAAPPPCAAALRALLEQLQAGPHRVSRFLIRKRQGHYFVRTSEIEAAVAEGNYVGLIAGGRSHLIRDTMQSFELKVPADQFVRVHRSVVVNLDYVARIEPLGHGAYRITMKGGIKFETNRAFGERLRSVFG